MVDENLGRLTIEEIPDTALVYRWVSINKFIHKKIPLDSPNPPINAFVPKGDGVSVLWSKYCETPNKAQSLSSFPDETAIAKLNVEQIRSIKSIDVKHAPITGVQAHSNIIGIPLDPNRSVAIRKKLAKLAIIVLPIVSN